MCLIVSKKFIIIVLAGILGILTTGILLWNALLFTNSGTLARGYVALIIDDFGNRGEGTEEMLNLGIPLTAAVMPFLPYSRADADMAHQAGLEVIMHVPMEPVNGKASWLGPRGITSELEDREIEARLEDGLKELKWAIGMNNHMGSKVMQNSRIVKALLDVAQKHDLLFIDSRTTRNSAVPQWVGTLNYPYLARDEFLESPKNLSHIKKQLRKLGEIALKRGYAIGIGHVGHEGGKVTAQAIKEVCPELENKGICFVFASQIKEVVSYYKKNTVVPSESDMSN